VSGSAGGHSTRISPRKWRTPGLGDKALAEPGNGCMHSRRRQRWDNLDPACLVGLLRLLGPPPSAAPIDAVRAIGRSANQGELPQPL